MNYFTVLLFVYDLHFNQLQKAINKGVIIMYGSIIKHSITYQAFATYRRLERLYDGLGGKPGRVTQKAHDRWIRRINTFGV